MNILVALDQLIGAFFFIDADDSIFGLASDETISSYVGRKYHGKWQERLINWIMLHITGEKDHCANNIEKQYLGM